MSKKHRITKKKQVKRPELTLFKSPSRPYVAGFPIAKGAFYNELWKWDTLENVLV